METAITITISLCDAREANDRIYDNRWLTSQLQQTATNQWRAARVTTPMITKRATTSTS